MSPPTRHPWIFAAFLIGAAYALIGILFGLPHEHAKFWRLSAWFVSAVLFAAHITYERLRLRSSPVLGALHVSSATAFGAFGLAVAANLHSLTLGSAAQHRLLLAAALVLWPAITAVPAFLTAWVASALLARTPL